MPVFTYNASDQAAEIISGTIAADTPRHARDLLRERGLVIRDIRTYQPPTTRSHRLISLGHRQHTTQIIRELSTLLGAGVPLIEAIETIARQHKRRFRSALLLLRDRISAGASLAQSMREQPNIFDDLAINITEVGEDSGTLDTSLDRLADYRERSQQLKGKLSTALIYPAIVLVMAIFSSLFLMTFVIPKILQPLIEQNQPLPLPTRIIKAMSDWLIHYGWTVAIAGAALIVVSSIFLSTTRGKMRWHRTLLRLPLLGDLFRKQAIVHMAVVMTTLLKSGIVFLRAIQIAQAVDAGRL